MDAEAYPINDLCEKADELASASTLTPSATRHSAAAMRENGELRRSVNQPERHRRGRAASSSRVMAD